jgi:hypothetical protein
MKYVVDASVGFKWVYVALAEKKRIQFITVDDKVISNLQKDFPFIRHLSTIA